MSTQIGANALASDDTKSSAIVTSLAPGVYTFVVRGAGDSAGIVLLDVYDADPTNRNASFVNITTRAYSTTGNGVTIGGFVISGTAPKRVLLRGMGPTLVSLGVPGTEVLEDLTIELHKGAPAIASNDNWGTNASTAEIRATAARIGATPFAITDSASAALLTYLQPGAYTFLASGTSGSSGVVLVEVYDADRSVRAASEPLRRVDGGRERRGKRTGRRCARRPAPPSHRSATPSL